MQVQGGDNVSGGASTKQTECAPALDQPNNNDTSYCAWSPSTGSLLSGRYSHASSKDLSVAMSSASEAYSVLLNTSPKRLAAFLAKLAVNLEANQDSIIQRCTEETALPATPRLTGEVQRVVSFLKMYSEMILSGETSAPNLTTPLPKRAPQPRADIRMCNIGIGPVVVIEASNFPFAFGVIGNDTASAWAAGCPVIAKVHPLHPGTSELIAGIVSKTLNECGLPPGMFTLLHGGPEVVEALVKQPEIRGVGFTGSKATGEAIRLYASQRPDPIELSLELGSVNPLFIFDAALERSLPETLNGLISASLNASGQFCTSPGIVFIPKSSSGRSFVHEFKERYLSSGIHTLLGRNIANAFRSRVAEISALSGVETCVAENPAMMNSWQVTPTVFVTNSEIFKRTPLLIEETFGPAILLVECPEQDYPDMAKLFTGELTATIHCPAELAPQSTTVQNLHRLLVPRVGRIIYNGYPPGVELCPSINHGGPWPSASSRFSAVGPDAVHRWVRRICFQNAPDPLLPEPIQESNPLNVIQTIDGVRRSAND